MTQAGDLDRRIVIKQPTDGQDAAGGKTASYTTYATVWAQYKALRGNEYFAANQMNAQFDGTFRIRYLSGLTNSMRIEFDGKVWDIISIAVVGLRNEFQDVMARVHQAG